MKISLFGKTIEFRNADRPSNLRDDGAWVQYLSGNGYAVTAESAIRVAAVIRAVDVVAKTIASLPFELLRKTQTGREKAKDHHLYSLLHDMPNPETTAYEFWHMYVFNLMLTKGAYAKIVRDRNGFIRELWNIPTANVIARRNTQTNERYIIVTDGSGSETLYPESYMYTPALRFSNSDYPTDFISIAQSVLGLTMALNGHAQDYFENGSNLGGFIEYPGKMGDKAYQNFKESWADTYAGVTKAHKIAFLESGVKFTGVVKNPTDSQALESRQYQVIEVCRLLGVPPHKVFDLGRATWANVEQMNIEYVQETLDPMTCRIHQTVYKDLLSARDRITLYPLINTKGLLRGDTAARTQLYNTMRQTGVYSANDVLNFEDMDLIPDEKGGNDHHVNGNMITLESARLNIPKGGKSVQTAQGGGNQ